MTISIIIPCRNERAHIRDFMQSLLAQTLDAGDRMEVLVADGMSDDGTREILAACAREVPAGTLIRVIDNPGRIVSTGLNAAIRASTGDIILRMDVHTVYAPDYVRESVRVLRETGADNAGGPWVAEGRGVIGKAIAAAFHVPFCNGGGKAHEPAYEGEVDTVYLGCWTREAFEKAGLFDTGLVRNQDDELNFRLRRMGGRVWQSPRIRSTYTPRGSLKALFRQYMQYGYWKVAILRKHRGLASWRHAVPALFVASLLVGIAAAAVTALAGAAVTASVIAQMLGAEVILYAAACILAAAPLAASVSLPVLLSVPLVIAVYHFAYGFGFLMGLGSTLAGGGPAAGESRMFSALTR